jgi:acetolactate synthase regulatory subunit
VSEQHVFELAVHGAPGAIERVLSVVRRRHLGVRSFQAEETPEGGWSVSIRARAIPHEAALALKQFSTLIDVTHAQLRDDDQPTR